ncbi:hypothetical protein ScPMuIL_005355 [Solemya velum]
MDNLTDIWDMDNMADIFNVSDFDFEPEMESNYIHPWTVIWCVALVLELFGNTLVILSFARFSEFRNTLTAFVFVISLSHVLCIITHHPIMIVTSIKGQWLFNTAICKLVPFVQDVVRLFTTWILAIIALYMLMAVKFTKYGVLLFQLRHVWKYAIVIAIVSCLMCLPIVFIYRVESVSTWTTVCLSYDEYGTIYTFYKCIIGVLVLPLTFMLISYGIVYKDFGTIDHGDTVYLRVAPSESDSILEKQSDSISHLCVQDVKMMWIVSICHGLIQVTLLILYLNVSTIPIFILMVVVEELGFLILPLIYVIASQNFRTCFYRILCCCCRQ